MAIRLDAPSLEALLEEVGNALGLSDAALVAMATRIEAQGLREVDDFAFHSGEAFRHTGPSYSEQVRRLGDAVCTGEVTIDNAAGRAAVTRLVRLCMTSYEEKLAKERPEEPTPSVKTDAEKDARAGANVYVNLFKFNHGTVVALHLRLTPGWCAKLISQVRSSQCLADLPAAARVPRHGAGISKVVTKLGAGEDAPELTTAVEAKYVEGKEAQLDNVRALLFGMVGACSVEITPEAFNSSNYGWVRIHSDEGAGSWARVLWTLESAMELFYAFIAVAEVPSNHGGWGRMVDAALFEFSSRWTTGEYHPSQIVEMIVKQRLDLFVVKAGDSGGTSTGVSPTADARVVRTTDGKGVCMNWMSGGNCTAHNEGQCPHAHPANFAGLAIGSQRKPRRPSWGSGSDPYGGYHSWSYHDSSAIAKNGKGGGKGGGKAGGKGGKGGKGGAGKGGGGGGGWSWN